MRSVYAVVNNFLLRAKTTSNLQVNQNGENGSMDTMYSMSYTLQVPLLHGTLHGNPSEPKLLRNAMTKTTPTG